eukprot:CAMPEP_0205998632 /NCGR_PEP_ID=MMETSP1464-20131121/352_1 /ASSEMBLY_ACC=CAM_ASM_001124 /TAXON_ID=119497 /ORGANISM="Exanthemachrysis gayraliae, Strain RCC1523" /LENGTH=78 /DNA_ID=CAMNT_0053371783 /DNA_START=17 /DNA_END=253 /DNA_ORIENTATION=+
MAAAAPFFTRRLAAACGFSFILGAGMELFMIKTGFYEIVTEKEAERYVERVEQHRELVRRMREREAGGQGPASSSRAA